MSGSRDRRTVSRRRCGCGADTIDRTFPRLSGPAEHAHTRFQYQLFPRIWLAAGASYGSGLPFEYEGTYEQALDEYGPQVVNRLNFDRGRILPTLAVNASLGADLYRGEKLTTRLQLDGENLNNRLNVIDFGGLFSGNAIAPGRSFALRLNMYSKNRYGTYS